MLRCEYRQFLLYTGPIALKHELKSSLYNHFTSLSVATRILCSAQYNQHYDYAHELLCYFVKKFSQLYGKCNLSYNVHNLIHIVNDVKKFGPLDSFSAFKFENYLYKLKNQLRVSKSPLEQIHNRILE